MTDRQALWKGEERDEGKQTAGGGIGQFCAYG